MNNNRKISMSSTPSIDRSDLFIGGAFVEADSAARVQAINPATEEVIGSVPEGNQCDVDRAVAAARAAFGAWRRTSGAERAAILLRVADGIAERSDELKNLLMLQNGSPKWWREQDVTIAQMLYRQASAAAAQHEEEVLVEGPGGGKTLLQREPIGVVAAIAPWNAPQALQAIKVANAMAAGCTVVAKPSPETSLDSYILAEIMRDAGVPDGVYNFVTGGRETGAALVAHPGINKVSFTGSTESGKAVARECANTLKPLIAELGGKSAAVILEDADLQLFFDSLQREGLPFSGQACFCNARVIVPRKMQAEVVDGIVATLKSFQFGEPTDDATIMGPLVSARQKERVEAFIQSGLDEGAVAVLGGNTDSGFERGYYVAPTVFTNVTADMRIFKEEIFGPVITVSAYDSEEEAVALHDGTDFGLSGSVYSESLERATEFSRKLATGQLLINGRRGAPNAQRDMYKQSALGGGVDRMGGFLQTKGITQPSGDNTMKTIFG
jgi:aldehyde dehydrogenase (NAD+)